VHSDGASLSADLTGATRGNPGFLAVSEPAGGSETIPVFWIDQGHLAAGELDLDRLFTLDLDDPSSAAQICSEKFARIPSLVMIYITMDRFAGPNRTSLAESTQLISRGVVMTNITNQTCDALLGGRQRSHDLASMPSIEGSEPETFLRRPRGPRPGRRRARHRRLPAAVPGRSSSTTRPTPASGHACGTTPLGTESR
jgi:hypothetical protein